MKYEDIVQMAVTMTEMDTGVSLNTVEKQEMIDRILTLEEKKKLKVNVWLYKACGITPAGIIEIVRNNWILFALWSLIMAIIGMALEPIVQRFFGTDS